MGNFYSGFGGHKSQLGYCEDGIVYSGRTPVGRYENGNIYNQFKEHVGSYGNGSIYDSFGTHIASYNNGDVYNKYLNSVVGKEQIGSYENDPAEAAALVLLFLGGDSINNGSEQRKEETSESTSGATTYSSIDILDVLLYCLVVLFKVIPCIWWVCIPVLLIMWLGFLGVIFAILYLLAFCLYCRILIKSRAKKEISSKTLFAYVGKWFLKGPFAYKDIIALKKTIE